MAFSWSVLSSVSTLSLSRISKQTHLPVKWVSVHICQMNRLTLKGHPRSGHMGSPKNRP